MPQAPHAVELEPPDLTPWTNSSTGVKWVQERDSGQSGPEVLLTALLHGNEYAGALTLDAFLRCGLMPRKGRITAVFCNMDAFERFDKAKPDASRFVDEDFNRVWSIERLNGKTSNSELQRARAIRPFVDRATHILDLHSMHEPCSPLWVTGLLPRNIQFAQQLGMQAQIIVDNGHADGTRMRDYGAFADAAGSRIALLLEAGQHWEATSLKVSRNALMRFLLATGAFDYADVPIDWLQPDAKADQPVTITHRVVATSMDFEFTQDFYGGEVIPLAGTQIAHNAGRPVVTPYDQCVIVMPSIRQLRPGVTTVRLGYFS
jgi:predicted deacylase